MSVVIYKNIKFGVREGVIVLFSFVFILQLLNRIFLCTSYNPNLEGIESTFVYYIQRALDHQAYYQSPISPPFYLHQSPPVYTYLVSKMLSFFNILPTDVHQIYFGGRIINLVANLATVGVFYLIVRRFARLTFSYAYILSVIVFLSFFSHNYAVRVDSLKSLLLILSLYFVLIEISGHNAKGTFAILAGLFTAIAVFTKQDAFSFLFLITLCLLKIKKPKIALLYFLFTCLVVFIGMSAIWIKYGNYFFENVIVGLTQGISFDYLYKRLPILVPVLGLFLFIIGFVSRFYSSLKSNKIAQFLLLLFVLSFGIASISLLKWGSSAVYCMDTMLVLFLLAAFLIQKMKRRSTAFLFLGCIAFLISDFTLNKDINKTIYSPAREQTMAANYVRMEEIADSITIDMQTPGVLCLVKDLTNHLYPYCLFPTFEAEFPAYMFCDTSLFNSSPKLIFSYSSKMVCQVTQKIVMNKKCLDFPQFLSLDCLSLVKEAEFGEIEVFRNIKGS